MTGAVVNSAQFMRGLDKFEERFTKMFRQRMRKLVSEGMSRLIAKTPVNTGQAVMNYVATGGKPYQGAPKQAGDPVEATNHLALGAERLRPAAAAVSRSTVASVDFADPFKVFWITNRSPDIGGLEHGELPHAPYTPRSPAGMFGVTVQELLALLSSGKI